MPEPRDTVESHYDSRWRETAATKLIWQTIGRAKALRQPIQYPGKPEQPEDEQAEGQPGDDQAEEPALRALGDHSVALITSRVFLETGPEQYQPRRPHPDGILSLTLKAQAFDHFDLFVPKVEAPDYIDNLERWCGWIKERCNRALLPREGLPIRYIVFGELTFPSFWPGRPAEPSDVDIRRRLRHMRDDLDNFLQALATDRNLFIIGGSYHDPLTFQNVACVYFPDRNYTIDHSKLTAAQAVREHIKVARGVRYPIYSFEEARFCVLICSDAFDLNIFFEQIYKLTLNPDSLPQIYFVPSYYLKSGRQNQMIKACQQLSMATGATVVFVNQERDTEGMSAFIGGVRQKLQPDPQGHIAFLDLRTPHVVAEKAKHQDVREGLKSILRG